MREDVANLMDEGIPLIPITRNSTREEMIKFLDMDDQPDLKKDTTYDGWINFYRQDDVSAVAYFYLDQPVNELLRSLYQVPKHRRYPFQASPPP